MQPDTTQIAKLFAAAGVEATSEEMAPAGMFWRVRPQGLRAALTALKDSEHDFAFMVDLFGVDTTENVDVVYHLRSFTRDEEILVKSGHAYGSVLTSIWDIYPAALMPERECAEMFGLKLAGHPNPKHLLLTEDVEPLLLKSVEIRGAEEVRNR